MSGTKPAQKRRLWIISAGQTRMEASCFPPTMPGSCSAWQEYLRWSLTPFPVSPWKPSGSTCALSSAKANKHHAPAASFEMIWPLLSHLNVLTPQWRKHFRFINRWPYYESQVKKMIGWHILHKVNRLNLFLCSLIKPLPKCCNGIDHNEYAQMRQ